MKAVGRKKKKCAHTKQKQNNKKTIIFLNEQFESHVTEVLFAGQ